MIFSSLKRNECETIASDFFRVSNQKLLISNQTHLALPEVLRSIKLMFVTSKIRVVTPRRSPFKHCFNACLPSFKAFLLKRTLVGHWIYAYKYFIDAYNELSKPYKATRQGEHLSFQCLERWFQCLQALKRGLQLLPRGEHVVS